MYQMTDESPGDRLRQARIRAGYSSAGAAARRLNINEQTYRAHENGTRGLTRQNVRPYARVFKVSPEYLLYGTGERQLHIPLVGYVGAGAEVFAIDDHAEGGGLAYVDPPPEASLDMVAVEVRGWSMYPAHWPGDVLYYREHAADVESVIGDVCVVRLADGRVFVKVIEHGSQPGLHDLTSFNEPRLRDQRIEWAAPVEWTDQRGRRRAR